MIKCKLVGGKLDGKELNIPEFHQHIVIPIAKDLSALWDSSKFERIDYYFSYKDIHGVYYYSDNLRGIPILEQP